MLNIGFRLPFRYPQGGSTPFDPADLPGIQRYGTFAGLLAGTDNEYGVVNGSSGVTSYKDLSGKGNHAISVTNYPDLASDCIQFTSANSDRLLISSPTFITNAAGEVLLAIKDTAGPGVPCYFTVGSNNGNTNFVAFGLGSDNKITMITGGGTVTTAAITRTLNAYHLVSFSTDGASTKIFWDGIERPVITADPAAWFSSRSLNQFSFCSALDTTPNYYNGGIIADIICNEQQTTANRMLAFNWLNSQL